jgi:hypothetical protein
VRGAVGDLAGRADGDAPEFDISSSAVLLWHDPDLRLSFRGENSLEQSFGQMQIDKYDDIMDYTKNSSNP